jgi:hypothetical protein
MRIFDIKEKKMIEGLRKLQNEGFHNLCSSPNIIKTIKFRRMRTPTACFLLGLLFNLEDGGDMLF